MATKTDLTLPTTFTKALSFVKKQGAKFLDTAKASKDLILYLTCLHCRNFIGNKKPAITDGKLSGQARIYEDISGISSRAVQRQWILGDIIMRTKADFTAFIRGGNFSDAQRISGKLYTACLEGEIEDGNDLDAALSEYRKATGKTSSKGKKASKGSVESKQKKALELLGAILGKDSMKKLADVLGFETEDGAAEFWKLFSLLIDDRHAALNKAARRSKKTG